MTTPSTAPSLSASWWQPLLDQIDYGIVVTSKCGRVLHANRAAHQHFTHGDPVRLAGERLESWSAQDQAELHQAIGAAATRQRRRLMTLRGELHSMPVAVVPLSSGLDELELALVLIGRQTPCL